jgi:RNA-directed DNA polymerase
MVFGERNHAEALREEVAAVLAQLGLRLSPEKTRVVHIDEGFDFLGIISDDSGNEEHRSTTSTPNRPGKQSRRSRTR